MSAILDLGSAPYLSIAVILISAYEQDGIQMERSKPLRYLSVYGEDRRSGRWEQGIRQWIANLVRRVQDSGGVYEAIVQEMVILWGVDMKPCCATLKPKTYPYRLPSVWSWWLKNWTLCTRDICCRINALQAVLRHIKTILAETLIGHLAVV